MLPQSEQIMSTDDYCGVSPKGNHGDLSFELGDGENEQVESHMSEVSEEECMEQLYCEDKTDYEIFLNSVKSANGVNSKIIDNKAIIPMYCSNKILLTKMTKVNDEECECFLCEEVSVEATVINCGHNFCGKCISEWMNEDSKCPICRTEVTNQTENEV